MKYIILSVIAGLLAVYCLVIPLYKLMDFLATHKPVQEPIVIYFKEF